MGARGGEVTAIVDEEDAEAEVEIWRYVFGFAEIGVVKCAIELGIADALEAQGDQPMTLSQLSATLGCPPSSLYRIMRFLVHRGVFKEKPIATIRTDENDTTGYAQTPISRRLMRHGERSMAALVLLENSPVMLAPWHALAARIREGGNLPAFEATHGKDLWEYTAGDPVHSKLFNDAMACHARVVVPAIVEGSAKLFEGVGTVVNVGGGDGTTLRQLVKAFPWLRGINFDLPHVVSMAPPCEGIDHIGGDMFHSVPEADVAFLMWVLHDWTDEDCIRILRKCGEAIVGEGGKVIIVDSVIDDGKDHTYKGEAVIEGKVKEVMYNGVGLMLDMVMMAHTNHGKERTREEWTHVLDKAGFTRYTFTPIPAVQAIIQAYP